MVTTRRTANLQPAGPARRGTSQRRLPLQDRSNTNKQAATKTNKRVTADDDDDIPSPTIASRLAAIQASQATVYETDSSDDDEDERENIPAPRRVRFADDIDADDVRV